MTRRRQRYKRATPGEPFLLMPEWVLNSDPWLTMSVDARVIVIDVCTRWNGETFWKVRINNNGAIHYGARQ